jgi:hypothetical protein
MLYLLFQRRNKMRNIQANHNSMIPSVIIWESNTLKAPTLEPEETHKKMIIAVTGIINCINFLAITSRKIISKIIMAILSALITPAMNRLVKVGIKASVTKTINSVLILPTSLPEFLIKL